MKSIEIIKIWAAKIALILEFIYITIHCSWLAFSNRNYVIAIGFSFWKRTFIKRFFAGKKLVFVNSLPAYNFAHSHAISQPIDCIIWGCKDLELNIPTNQHDDISITRLEDGFVRSRGLGVDKNAPWSLCLDNKGIYYDASKASDLEDLCNQFDATDPHYNIDEVKRLQDQFTSMQISKYNLQNHQKLAIEPGAILVLGQVEDDQSILANRNAISSNKALLERAQQDYPDKKIYFKQHPDCLSAKPRRGFLKIQQTQLLSELSPEISVIDAIKAVDHVYTISSLGGFEALLHNKQVSVFGCPFYAGWGLTKDHVEFPRRQRVLTITELFYLAYIRYPKYFNPQTGERKTIADILAMLGGEENHKIR